MINYFIKFNQIHAPFLRILFVSTDDTLNLWKKIIYFHKIMLNLPSFASQSTCRHYMQIQKGIFELKKEDIFLDESNFRIDINQNTIENVLVKLLKNKEVPVSLINANLIVLLLPPIGGDGFENIFFSNEIKNTCFVATTCDGVWEQIIIRAICKIIGLEDEFYLDSAQPVYPDRFTGSIIESYIPNLLYSNTSADTLTALDTKWEKLMFVPNKNLKIHRFDQNSNQPDLNPLEINFAPEEIEMWEGGGGYKNHVFRAAKDCLMRRCIGDKKRPVRTSKVSLCPACENYLRTLILEFGRRNNIEELQFRGFIQKYSNQ